MIAKAVKGRGFRGALAYDLGKDEGRILDTNMAGESLRELSAEFAPFANSDPISSAAVLHVSLSAAPGENLSDAQWRAIGRHYLQGIGFTENQSSSPVIPIPSTRALVHGCSRRPVG